MDMIAMPLRDLRKFKGSLVYTLTRAGITIYVGRSNVGIDRPLDSLHNAMKYGLPEDIIKLHFCKSASEAAKLEKHLIHVFHPALNIRKPTHKPIGKEVK
jgi:hypothetical protein